MSLGKLIVYSSERKKVAEYTVEDEVFRIGRGSKNDLSLPDPLVSGFHCKISPTMVDLLLEDMSSTNGTYVNFERVKKHALQDTDVIMFRNYLIRFLSNPDVPANDPSVEIPDTTHSTYKDWWPQRKKGEQGDFKVERGYKVTKTD